MTDARKILDGLNHCLPVTEADAMMQCSTCPYDKPCHEREGKDSVSLPLALIEDMRRFAKESLGFTLTM